MGEKSVYFLQIQHNQDLPFLCHWDSCGTPQSVVCWPQDKGNEISAVVICAGQKRTFLWTKMYEELRANLFNQSLNHTFNVYRDNVQFITHYQTI